MAAHTVEWQDELPAQCRGGAISIGNFDGVHLGHARLLSGVREEARKVGGPAVVVTFDPHPLTLLRPGIHVTPLTTLPDRLHWLHQLGADHVVVLKSTPDLLALSAAEFFERVIRARFQTHAIVEGDNFGFGHNREGNVPLLEAMCRSAGIALTIVAPVVVNGKAVSSSGIRAALSGGDIASASQFLGRPHRLHGTVGMGQQRGQKIGFPTANLEQLETFCPADGVYAVRGLVEGQLWSGAANVGPNPTFGENSRKVEVHLFDFAGDLYGRPLAVDFIERLRELRSFASAEELVAQIRQDVAQARHILAGSTGT